MCAGSRLLCVVVSLTSLGAPQFPASESVVDALRESWLTFYSLTFDVQHC